jgi:uridine kinase
MTIENIADKIKQYSPSKYPVLVAIEGFGGSGKTTFADKLKNELGSAFVVNIDDFIVKERITEISWDKGAFDRKRLEQQVLLPITTEQRASYQKLIWDTETLSEPIAIPDVRYLIVEGISSYHPDIAHYYDFKIWINTPIEIAKERGHARDGSNENAKHWDLWAKNDLRYQEKYHSEREADFIFDNTYLV